MAKGDWEPEHFDDNPIADAIYNVAAQLGRLATATDGLIFGLKYGRGQAEGGRSIAESIEVAIGEASERIAAAIAEAGESRVTAATVLREVSDALGSCPTDVKPPGP